MRYFLTTLLWLVLNTSYTPSYGQCPGVIDYQALVDLYEDTEGIGWMNQGGWLQNCDISTWDGVTVEDGRVTRLVLNSNNLEGELPSSIGTLTSLEVLQIRHNPELSGSIPSEIGNLSSLTHLYLDRNAFTGEIPLELWNNTNYKILYLYNNRDLSGTIPATINQQTALRFLYLQNLELSGEIPEEITQIPTLERLYLHGTGLSGHIPSGFGSQPLNRLFLQNNNLDGCIPEDIANLCGQDVRLFNNVCLSHEGGDIDLFCADSTCDGPVDCSCRQLDDYDALVDLYMATGGSGWTNQGGWLLNCDISTWEGVTVEDGRVTRLVLVNNNLEGELPSSIGTLTSLEVLQIRDNPELTGSIPSEIGNLSSLTHLYLDRNGFTGEIPLELWDNTNYRFLYLYNNRDLSGTIPATINQQTALRFLYIQNLDLSGEIPEEITQIPTLERLYLHGTGLSGHIPSGFGSQPITRLFLQNNNLDGCIPEDIANLCGQDVRLFNNDCLSHEGGDIDLFCADSTCNGPVDCSCRQIEDYQALVDLYEATEGINWNNKGGWLQNCDISTWDGVTVEDGRVTRLSLNSNNLDGTLPPSIGALSHLENLQIRDNPELTGSIPPEIGNLSSLTHLYLDRNAFTGEIPSELWDNTGYIVLYLYNNRDLSGIIPATIIQQTSLRILFLQNLDLSGEIPEEITQIPTLERLYLHGTGLSGHIPSGFGSQPLNRLFLQNNNLEGCIPEDLANLCGQDIRLFNNECLSHDEGDFADFCADPICKWSTTQCTNCEIAVCNEICDNGIDDNNDGLIDCADSDCDGVASCPCAHPDYDALVALYNSTAGPNWNNNSGWLEGCNVCDWGGIECENNRVVIIDFLYNNMVGEIPLEIGQMVRLKELILHGNRISGTIPSEISQLIELEVLQLGSNSLTGEIPESMVDLDKLRVLQLGSNSLTGSIPEYLNSLTSLEDINLCLNEFTGEIPTGLDGLVNLFTLNLGDNSLTGSIPPELGSISSFGNLFLRNNMLEGCIPEELMNLCGISISLSGNTCLSHNGGDFASFCAGDPCEGSNTNCNTCNNGVQDPEEEGVDCGGICAPCPCTHPDLEALVAIYNALDGPNWTTTEQWDPNNCDVCNWDGIQCDINQRVNSIELPNLNSSVTGVLPAEIGDLEFLEVLTLNEGDIQGPLPTELGSLSNLVDLKLELNSITGTIPPSLGNLSSIANLSLTGNQITGEIPIELSQLQNLNSLFLNVNQLTGELPEWLAGMPNLSVLILNNNQFYGCIPQSYLDLCAEVVVLINNPCLSNNADFAAFCAAGVCVPSTEPGCEVDPCTNGVQDEAMGETGVDCGGSCEPCTNSFDLALIDISPSATVFRAGDLFSINYAVENASSSDIVGDNLSIVLSADTIPDVNDYQFLNSSVDTIFALDTTYFVSNLLAIPTVDSVSRVYYIIATLENSQDTLLINNTRYRSIFIGPDNCNQSYLVCTEIDSFDISYVNLFDDNSFERTLDKSLEVGTTVGIPNVSPTGAASYSIPISLPPGTMGMQPDISLVYNSQSRSGVAGYGWHLAAGSSISRVNKSIYFDGSRATVQLDTSDRFAIDGQRLQVVNGVAYGSETAIYQAEIENFNRVSPMEVNGNGPTWFKVEAKNGWVYEYGNSSDSKLTEGLFTTGTVVSWSLNKVTDPYGNYMLYQYSNNGEERSLERIDYTGNPNANLSPYNTILFNYGERFDKNETYIATKKLEQSTLLTSVQIIASGEHFKTYELEYSNTTVDQSSASDALIASHLNQIQEFGSDFTALNSTRFKYESLNTSISLDQVIDISQIPVGENRRIVDLNGDGLSDIVVFDHSFIEGREVVSGADLYIKSSNSTEEFIFIGSENLEDYIGLIGREQSSFGKTLGTIVTIAATVAALVLDPTKVSPWIISGASTAAQVGVSLAFLNDVYGGNAVFGAYDFNGDTREEVVIYNPSVSSSEVILTLGLTDNNQIERREYFIAKPENTYVGNLLINDFDGDSRMDFMAILFDNNNQSTVGFKLALSSDNHVFRDLGFENYRDIVQEFRDARFIPGDYDGDGITELLVIGGYSSNFLGDPYSIVERSRRYIIINNGDNYYLERGPFTSDIFDGFPNKADYVQQGDFNGDGLTDLLVSCGNNIWQIGIFDGERFVQRGFEFALGGPSLMLNQDLEYLELRDNQSLSIADFNGDGKSDILEMPPAIDSTTFEEFDPFEDLYQRSYVFNSRPYELSYSTGIGFKSVVSSNNLLLPTGEENIVSRINEYIPYENINPGYNVSIGDFNGDGSQDLLVNGYGAGTNVQFSTDLKERLLTDVLDGFNNRYSFEYGVLTDPLVYVQDSINRDAAFRLDSVVHGTSEYCDRDIYDICEAEIEYTTQVPGTYPYNYVTTPLNVVQSHSAPTNHHNITRSTTTYKYHNALVHRHGKGFMGFLKNESWNEVQDVHNIAESTQGFTEGSEEFVNNAPILIPSRQEQRLISTGELVSSSTTQNDIVPRDGYMRYWIQSRQSHTIDHINQRQSFATASFDTNGNITKQSTLVFGLDQTLTPIQSDSTIFSDFNSNGSWLPNKPETVITTQIRLSEDPYSKTTTYQYNAEGSLSMMVDFAGLPQALTTTYPDAERDEFGNAQKVEISGADVITRTSSTSFDVTGRFALEQYNALNQKSEATYDPKWGTVLTNLTVDSLSQSVTYDGFGRTEDIVTPEGYTVTTDYHWDDGSFLDVPSTALYYVSTDHPAAPNSRQWFDAFSRPIMNTSQDFKYGVGQFYETSTISLYDERGRSKTSTLPFRSGETQLLTTNIYDRFNRIETINSPTGQSSVSYIHIPNGELTISSTLEDGRTSSQTSDASGKTTRSEDTGGGVTSYTYYSHCQVKDVNVDGTEVARMTYDEYVRQTTLIEPNSGTTAYNYNSFSELIYQDDSRPDMAPITMTYDLLGRVDNITKPEGLVDYTYVNNGNGLNQVQTITNHNGITESFTYDHLSRPLSKTEVINGQSFTHSYTYTSDFGQLDTKTYPSGLTVDYDYYPVTGFMQHLKDHTGSVIYEPKESNQFGQMTLYELGNGLTTQLDYDDFGILDQIQTLNSSVFNMTFDFNVQNGLLNQRADIRDPNNMLVEDFGYDEYYRLKTVSMGGVNTLTMGYDPNGNITQKSDINPSVNSFSYNHTEKIHALTDVEAPGPISFFDQVVTYNSAQQPLTISQGDDLLEYTYAADEQRRYAKLSNTHINSTLYERYYCGDYEYQILSDGTTQDIHYLDAGITVVRDNAGSFDYFYTYSDYQGTTLTVTDDSGQSIIDQSFDAWGRKRNAADWSFSEVENYSLPWLYRSYTTHEMIPEMDLINMNGRMYDPQVARMLSVDNYAGLDGTSQSYNRYSYVYNNPLMYYDPSGEFAIPGLSMKAAVKFFDNVFVHSLNLAAQRVGAPLTMTIVASRVAKGTLFKGIFGTIGQFAGSKLRDELFRRHILRTQGELREDKPNFFEKAQEFHPISRVLLDMVDDISITAQAINPLDNQTQSFTGELISNQNEIDQHFVNTTSIFVPVSRGLASVRAVTPATKLLPKVKLNAAQFSSRFQGTFIARLKPSLRGKLNVTLNKVTQLKVTKVILGKLDNGSSVLSITEKLHNLILD